MLLIGLIFLVSGIVMILIAEHFFDDNVPANIWARCIFILGLVFTITELIVLFSSGFAAVGMNLIFG